MSKTDNIHQIIVLLASALRHKIGAMVGREELYFKKYMLEFDARLEKAVAILNDCNFNKIDKEYIKEKVTEKLKRELKEREYIDNRKFDIMDEEIDSLLLSLGVA